MPGELEERASRPADRERLRALLSRRWSFPVAGQPLRRLHGRALGRQRLLLLMGAKSNVGSIYFQLFLLDQAKRLSDDAFALGLHNAGPFPGYNWIELVRYDAAPRFDGEGVDLTRGLERALFRQLAELLPPGGHLMVEYESPSQRESARVLTLGYPPVTSPLGYLLFQAGCRSFRDWYIPEGGREGPRKLQGFLPLDAAVAAAHGERLRRELRELLSRPRAAQHGDWGRAARKRAKQVLEALGRE